MTAAAALLLIQSGDRRPSSSPELHGRDGGRHQEGHDARSVACSAAGDAVATGKAEQEGGGLVKTLQLGALFGLWYLVNIYSKQVISYHQF